MNLDDIKKAVDKGLTVHWCNGGYIVEKTDDGRYFIRCTMNGDCTMLTWADGVTMNGSENDFYITEKFSR